MVFLKRSEAFSADLWFFFAQSWKAPFSWHSLPKRKPRWKLFMRLIRCLPIFFFPAASIVHRIISPHQFFCSLPLSILSTLLDATDIFGKHFIFLLILQQIASVFSEVRTIWSSCCCFSSRKRPCCHFKYIFYEHYPYSWRKRPVPLTRSIQIYRWSPAPTASSRRFYLGNSPLPALGFIERKLIIHWNSTLDSCREWALL